MPIDPDAIYDDREAAALLGLSERTLQRGRADATGPAYVRLSRTRVGYTGRAIQQWLDARTYPSLAAELAAQGARKPAA